jgi:DNA-binding transcriptional MerR regulator
MTQGIYSIKDLETLTGVKAHTIRIWEKRYQVVRPGRTATNIRYYDDQNLKKILNISILLKHGFKISHLVELSDDVIREKILNLSFNSGTASDQVDSLVMAMIELNDLKFEKTISTATLSLGFENTVLQIIYPFLERVGILWQTGSINPAHEHFVSNLLRQKLLVAIDGYGIRPKPNAKRFMLFLPENELHELGLLFYSYLVRTSGNKIIYLGQSVPFSDLIAVTQFKQPDVLITSITTPFVSEDVTHYITRLSEAFPKQKIYVTGLQVREMTDKFPANVKKLNNVVQFKDELTRYY